MALEVINIGSGLGQRDGDLTPDAWAKAKRMFAELYAAIPGLSVKLSVTVTAASTNDYTPGGAWPTGIGSVDFNPTTNDVIFTGIVAGSDGQTSIWTNVGTTYNGIFNVEDTGSAAANRLYGQGGTGANSVVPPGGIIVLRYSLLPNPRWRIG